SCDEAGLQNNRLTLRVTNGDDRVRVAVSDNGVGIPQENLTRIFSHGFTTKKDGHGFGLHCGALAAREMGGSLLAHSEGTGHGATFTLELPVQSSMQAL
ncbi:MAG TPA: ATP-binding protein, partial [Verrucomicrobiae bacterium]|nr:ATP-binding protein [Verrucomicrobiae bacterium]